MINQYISIKKDGTIETGIETSRRTGKRLIRDKKGDSLVSFPSDYVVVDLETSGLDSNYDEIIEVAAVKISNSSISDSFATLVKPDYELPDYIEEFTGITNEMVIKAPTIIEVLPALMQFVGNSVIVGHNANFDINFLYDTSMTLLGVPFTNNFVDTMRISRFLFPEWEHHTLGDLIYNLDLQGMEHHRALADCNSAFMGLERMRQIAIERFGSEEAFAQYFNTVHKHGYDIGKITATVSEIDPTNPLYGKICVFTGSLEKMKRGEALQHVVNLGGICGDSVTKKTNFLILGNNDYCTTIKDGKSAKQKKAEMMKLKGHDIEILSENVFYDILEEYL